MAKAKFNEIYEAIYRESKEPLEKSRKEARNRLIMAITISAIIGLISWIPLKSFEITIFAIIITFLICSFLGGKSKNYNVLFKEKVIRTLVEEYNENLRYSPNLGITPSVYRMGEFERYDRYNAEDSIRGVLESGYKIDMSEVHTEERHKDEDGHVSYSTIFRGLFAQVEFDKFILNTIKIRKNTVKIFDKKERIEMDSGEFEKIYDIYSENKIVTMQLLTADIMQMFIDFKEKYKITPELTIKENKLYIRFATGNVFESDVFTEALDYGTLKRYYDTIEFTIGITEKMLKNIKETEI